MRASRILALVGGVLALGWAAQFLRGPAEGRGDPATGTLAPYDSAIASAWEPVATLSVDAIGGGAVQALAERGDTLLVLQANQWTMLVAGQVIGTYGTAVTGAPGFLARAVGIGVTRDAILVLDGARHRLTRWSRAGEMLDAHEMQPTVGLGSQRHGMVVADDVAYVPTYVMAEEGGRWDLERLRGTAHDTLIAGHGVDQPGAAHNQPVAAPLHDGRLLVLDAASWRLRLFSASGGLEREGRREDPPHYAIPAAARVKLRALLGQMPPAQRRALELPAALTPIVAATAVGDSLLLTVIRTHDETAIAELLRLDGTPLARLWRDPDPHRIFALDGALFRVRERDDAFIVERQRLASRSR